MNYNKYESYIRVGHRADGSDLANFPTPSTLKTTLHDLDKDPFTDLEGKTHRNRVRHDVLDIEITYEVLSDNDIQYILNRISPVWIYIELTNKKTGQRTLHKVYASDKSFDTFKVWHDNNGWHETKCAFSVSFVEE